MPTGYQIKNQYAAPGLPQVMEYQHYYPFGMQLEALGYTSGNDLKNNYLYNGKELQEDYGLNWYDYGARMYDPVIGRFTTQDAYAEKYASLTPYQYGANNPIKYIDINGDSINVALIQRFDKENGTNYLGTIMNDLSAISGMAFSITSSGQLVYQKDDNGNPIISTRTDKDGNKSENGSEEGRKIIKDAISNTTRAFAKIDDSKVSNSPINGGKISLNPNQINNFIDGANNLDPRTLGWGMTFLHETLHSFVGGGLSDYLPKGTNIGQIETRLNVVREQLNQKGENFGRRMRYHSISFDYKGNFLPFNNASAEDINRGIIPATTSKYIKF